MSHKILMYKTELVVQEQDRFNEWLSFQ